MAEQTALFFTLFDVAIGRCAIAWSKRGIVGVLLPQGDDGALRMRLLRRHTGAREATPPEEVARAIEGIVALGAGEPRGPSDGGLDLRGGPRVPRPGSA